MKRNKARTKTFNIAVTEEEYELLHQAAAVAGGFASGWARDVLISRALRIRMAAQA